MQVTTNSYGQKTHRGRVTLKADTLFLNRANDGLDAFDARWRQPSTATVPAGTVVDYVRQETRSGVYHTVTAVIGGQVFYATRKTEG